MLLPVVLALVFTAFTRAQVPAQPIGYGVDLVDNASLQNYQCLRSQQYSYAFVGIYNASQGAVYNYAINSISNAQKAGLNVHIVHAAAPATFKTGAVQFQETYNYLRAYQLIPHTHPFVAAAAQVNVNVAFYTNWYDWEQITGGWVTTPRLLWYWDSLGYGQNAYGSNDFNDFRGFGGFTSAHVGIKQYAQRVTTCNVLCNVNRFHSNLVLAQAQPVRFEEKKN
ncbi:hypothetical protein QR680_010996 [Steinernema hermaphroditum]|uniref:Lysozyme n=1 Tax=Steinernema hermaphroditum TaxID=289476 RepID=A0AA39IRZ1_9BILA|nr:hypothetical protein QR680_010996 [Steinernema hermaphroditum]